MMLNGVPAELKPHVPVSPPGPNPTHPPMGRVGYWTHPNQNPPYISQHPHNPPQVERRAKCLVPACMRCVFQWELTWRGQAFATFSLFHSPPASATPGSIRLPTRREWTPSHLSPRGKASAGGSPPHLLRGAKNPRPQKQSGGRVASADCAPALLPRPADTSPQREGEKVMSSPPPPAVLRSSVEHHHCCSCNTCDVSLDVAEAEARTAIRSTTSIRNRSLLGFTSPGGGNAHSTGIRRIFGRRKMSTTPIAFAHYEVD